MFRLAQLATASVVAWVLAQIAREPAGAENDGTRPGSGECCAESTQDETPGAILGAAVCPMGEI